MIDRKIFVFNGKSSAEYGIYLTGATTFGGTTKTVEKVSIPGRNGDLTISSDRYENQSYVLHIGIVSLEHLHEVLRDFRSFMLASDGYCRLEDSYHPDEYRKAQFVGPIDFDVTLLMTAEADLTFDCMPQHYLKNGESEIVETKAGIDNQIYNPTYFPSLPKIEVTGYGTLQIGNGIVKVAQNSNGVAVIDCERPDCTFKVSGGNANPFVSVKRDNLDNAYPQLKPGTNTIHFDSTITQVNIVPRWWML